MNKAAAVGLLLIALVNGAAAAPTAAVSAEATQYSSVLRDVQHALGRRFSALSEGSLNQLALPEETADLFPAWGFPPRNALITWSFMALDSERVEVCATAAAVNVLALNGFYEAARLQHFQVSTTNCAGGPLPASLAFPREMVIKKTFSRQDVVLPERVLGALDIAGVPRGQMTKPAAILNAYAGGTSSALTLTLTNPSTTLYRFDSATLRSGFSVSSSCGYVWPGESCTVQVIYQNAQERRKNGALRLTFSQHAAEMPALLLARSNGTLTPEMLQALTFEAGPSALVAVQGRKVTP